MSFPKRVHWWFTGASWINLSLSTLQCWSVDRMRLPTSPLLADFKGKLLEWTEIGVVNASSESFENVSIYFLFKALQYYYWHIGSETFCHSRLKEDFVIYAFDSEDSNRIIFINLRYLKHSIVIWIKILIVITKPSLIVHWLFNYAWKSQQAQTKVSSSAHPSEFTLGG